MTDDTIAAALERLRRDNYTHDFGGREARQADLDRIELAVAPASAPEVPPRVQAPACTCPSGDGSLRWPCPVHPPEAQPVAWDVFDKEGNLIAGRVSKESAEEIASRWEYEGSRISPLYAHPPPSAPVGVEEDALTRALDFAYASGAEGAPFPFADCARQVRAALDQQPAAVDSTTGCWISVEHRLPTEVDYAEHHDVLVRYRYTDEPGRPWTVGKSFHDKAEEWNNGWAFGSCDHAEVSHWMPIGALLTLACQQGETADA